ncbi:MAG: GNAT family N-acetyltransferase [Chloroflexota bacterium]
MARNNSAVKVRRMTHDDQMKVNQIDRLLFGEQRVPTWPFSFETYWNIYGPGVSFVAEVGGQVVGFLAGTIVQQERSHSIIDLMHSATRSSRYPRIGYIDMIGILPENQGKNVGRALIDAFYDECRLNGATVRAHVKESDETLTRFLTRMGFKKWGTVTYEKD